MSGGYQSTHIQARVLLQREKSPPASEQVRLGILSFSAERNSYEQDMRVHTGIDTTKVSIGDMVILVSEVNALVIGGKQFHPDSNLCSEIELRSAEQLPIEIEEAGPTGKKRLDPVVSHPVDLDARWTASNTVGIYTLTIRLRIAH